MRTFRIAVYPGDGIGKEVTIHAVRVLREVERLFPAVAVTFEMELFDWSAVTWKETGNVVPPDFLDRLRPHDAILLGALGAPDIAPDSITLNPLIQIRQRFDQYACVRPTQTYPGVYSLLRSERASDVDFVVVRENSEGEYVNNGGRFKIGEPDEFALQTAIHTRKGIERILRYGFDLSRKRRRRLTMITKSNAQTYGYVLWDEVLDAIREEFSDVTADKQHVDAAAMNFVRRPEQFDVIVASNLFGDILTDLGAAIAGSLGLAPSANINPERRFPSLFEPVHGSAPDIAGEGTANPIGAILSVAMMVEWLGLDMAARRIRAAVERTLRAGLGTPDLDGQLGTGELADEIIQQLGAT